MPEPCNCFCHTGLKAYVKLVDPEISCCRCRDIPSITYGTKFPCYKSNIDIKDLILTMIKRQNELENRLRKLEEQETKCEK